MIKVYHMALSLAVLACSTAFAQGGFGEADANGDGKVSAGELEKYVSGKLTDFDRFKELMNELDKNKDGSVSEDEFEDRMTAVETVLSRPRPKLDEKPAAQRPRGRRRDSGLKVGQVAPTFKLKSLDGKSETDLNDFKGQKPIVLIFGSYT